jgi:hypothetical protein
LPRTFSIGRLILPTIILRHALLPVGVFHLADLLIGRAIVATRG